MHSHMKSVERPLNLEDEDKLDSGLLKRLAKIVEILQDIED